jgi:uncharacterized protein YeaO (DUF488 family)
VDAADCEAKREKMLDKTIADSFPASDPPSTLPDPNEDSFSSEDTRVTCFDESSDPGHVRAEDRDDPWEGRKRRRMINLKRVYEPASPEDGVRILVERLWPRGIKKDALKLDTWLKDVAPSDELRRWFGHDPKKWNRFRDRYFAELDAKPVAWKFILKAARRGRVTLIYSSRDTEHNNAVALRNYLHARMRSATGGRKRIA